MDATYGTTRTRLNQPQHAEEQCSPGKAALIGLGIIFIISGAAASGVLYSHQGYVSLSYLAAIPVGITLIVIGARCIPTSSSQQQNAVQWHRKNRIPAENVSLSLASSFFCLKEGSIVWLGDEKREIRLGNCIGSGN